MPKFRSFIARLASALPIPFFCIWIEQPGDARIVCRSGPPGSGYRWSVTDLSARVSGTASSFDDALTEARAAADALVRPAEYAYAIETSADLLRELGYENRAVCLFEIAQDLRGSNVGE